MRLCLLCLFACDVPCATCNEVKLLFSHNDSFNALQEFAATLNNYKNASHKCHLKEFGSGWGMHYLCDHDIRDKCHFLSFGINSDYSFDESLARDKNCSGIALDPTVDHPMKLTEGVIFLKAGANSPGNQSSWVSWSVPHLRKWLGHPLYALKMDCEGCEYSLADDILREDPLFFRHVYQLNIEIHIPRSFMSLDSVYSLGRLYRLLTLANMKLVHVDDGKCGPKDQRGGCQDLIIQAGIPCVPGCRSYLFSH